MAVSYDSREAGFSVLEAVVALAIVALTLSAFYSGLRVVISSIENANELASVERSARRLFAEIGVLYPLEEGTKTLRLDGGRLAVLEVRREAASSPAQDGPGMSLYAIEATFVSAHGAPPIRIHSARLAPTNPSR